MGSIGVRCARAHFVLYFHLSTQLASDHLHPEFRTDGRDQEINQLLAYTYPWDKLTDIGRRITERTLAIKRFGFKKVRVLAARPFYFRVEVYRAKDWKYVLPKVVAIIREETGDLAASVEVFQDEAGAAVEQWHLPMLQRLFG